jgi:hypothetical protein
MFNIQPLQSNALVHYTIFATQLVLAGILSVLSTQSLLIYFFEGEKEIITKTASFFSYGKQVIEW